MKKLFAIFLMLVLAAPVTVFAITCPTGQQPAGSMDSSGNITYTCQNTSGNSVYNGGTINALPSGALTYTPLEPLSPSDKGGYGSIQQYLQSAFVILISLGGLFAVTMLTLSGIRYMLSESFTDKDKAKQRIIASLWGLLLLASSWLILHTINPQLLQFNLTGIGIGSSAYTPQQTQNQNNTSSGQNLGNPDNFSNGNPYGFQSLSAPQGYAVSQALGCSFYNVTCLGAQQYITYDPTQVNTPAVQQAITNYNSNCSGVSNLWVGNVKTVDGGVVGAPGQTALVCAGPFQ